MLWHRDLQIQMETRVRRSNRPLWENGPVLSHLSPPNQLKVLEATMQQSSRKEATIQIKRDQNKLPRLCQLGQLSVSEMMKSSARPRNTFISENMTA